MQTELRTLDRNEFLKLVGTSIGAIVLTHCLSGCSSGGDDPAPNNPNNPGGGTVDFTLNIADAANAALATNGGSIVRSGVIVARTTAGAFLAVSQNCTHEGTPSVEFVSGNSGFFCPRHGSEFSSTGAVVRGPATSALKQYKTQFNATANTLRVFE